MKKILIVDDNASVRELFVALLRLEGFSVVTAEDGISGLHKAALEHPDLVITDLVMKNLDGFEVIRQLRQREEFSDLAIVAVTGDRPSFLERATTAGADCVLEKPVQIDVLVDTVKGMFCSRVRTRPQVARALYH
jgi:CheY-like chemotaxis protein